MVPHGATVAQSRSRAVADSFGYSDAWPRADKGPKNAIHGEQTKRESREEERERDK